MPGKCEIHQCFYDTETCVYCVREGHHITEKENAYARQRRENDNYCTAHGCYFDGGQCPYCARQRRNAFGGQI